MLKRFIASALLAVAYCQVTVDTACRLVMTVDCNKPRHGSSGPVCGTDIKTYPNDCELDQAHCSHRFIKQLHAGNCSTVDSITTTMSPQQVTDDITFVTSELCSTLSRIDCPVTTHNNENVCGTDEVTYPNFCEYEKQRCSHRHLTTKNMGACISPYIDTPTFGGMD